jgi:hypothetical protein
MNFIYKLIEMISIYPIPFFMMLGILIALITTVVEETKRKRRKNKK